MKVIVYIAFDNDIDGRGPEHIQFASLDEKQRDDFVAGAKDKNWLSKGERIYQLEEHAKKVWKQLDGVARLALQEFPQGR